MQQAWSRMLDANLKYYEALGKVTSDYVAALSKAILPGPLSFKLPFGVPSPHAHSAPPETGPVARSSGPLLVLEAPAGSTAHSAFVISNALPREATAPVMVSALRTERGTEIHPPVRVVPGSLSLAPGEKGVVQLLVTIGDDMQEGTDYFGVIRVPDLSTEQIPFVVRRVSRAAPSPATAPARKPARRRPPRSARR
jgi:hypothetical protein